MAHYKDLTNKTFGMLTALKLSEDKFDSNGTTRLWECRCKCGNIVYKSSRHLNEIKKLKRNDSCGCEQYKNYVGMKIGDLKVVSYAYSKNRKRFWNCECICGEKVVKSSLYLSKTKGVCVNIQKKQTRFISRIRHIFWSMKERCYNTKCKAYKYYGEKGIKICSQWLSNVTSFIDWSLNNGYQEELTIDRIDYNGNYCPENCRWVDNYVQANNKRNNKNILYNGEVKALRRWCRELGLPYRKTHKRLFLYNWSVDKSFDEKERVGFV